MKAHMNNAKALQKPPTKKKQKTQNLSITKNTKNPQVSLTTKQIKSSPQRITLVLSSIILCAFSCGKSCCYVARFWQKLNIVQYYQCRIKMSVVQGRKKWLVHRLQKVRSSDLSAFTTSSTATHCKRFVCRYFATLHLSICNVLFEGWCVPLEEIIADRNS